MNKNIENPIERAEMYFEHEDEIICTENQIAVENNMEKLNYWHSEIMIARGSAQTRFNKAQAQIANEEHICPVWFGKLYAKVKILGNLLFLICDRKRVLKSTYNKTKETIFMDNARQMLPRETFKAIWDKTKLVYESQSQNPESNGISTMSNEAQS